jgi:hypothetical protein
MKTGQGKNTSFLKQVQFLLNYQRNYSRKGRVVVTVYLIHSQISFSMENIYSTSIMVAMART